MLIVADLYPKTGQCPDKEREVVSEERQCASELRDAPTESKQRTARAKPWEIINECTRRGITLSVDNGRLRHELHFATPTASAQQYIESIRPHEEALIVFLGRLEEGEGYGMKELERHFLKLSWTAVGKKALDVALHAAWRLAHKRGLSWFALRMAVRSYPAALDRIPAKGGTVGPCPEDLLS